MSREGDNRFFWPMRDYVVWYMRDNVIGLVPEPKPVTSRHMMLTNMVCEELSSRFG
uniref:Uncharacterized protein n=1 Tax=Anguilla anguilla TaxID=7936 RepID=A0A0E9QLU3_ANGAN